MKNKLTNRLLRIYKEIRLPLILILMMMIVAIIVLEIIPPELMTVELQVEGIKGFTL